MTQKIRFIFLAFLLLFPAMPVIAADEAAEQFVLQAASERVSVGDSISITVSGKAMKDFYGSEITLDFPSDKLEYSGYASSLSGQAFFMEPTWQGNQIWLVFTFIGDRAGLSGDQSLYTLTFKAIGTGAAEVELDQVRAFNHRGEERAGDIGNGVKLSIESPASSEPLPDSSPNPTPTSKPTPSPSPSPLPTDSVLTLDGTVNANGKVTARVKAEELQAVAKLAKDRTVTINVQTHTEVQELQLELPVSQLDEIRTGAGKIQEMVIQTRLATVTLNTDLLKHRAVSLSSVLKLSVSMISTDELSPEVRERVGTAAVYDFTLSLDEAPLNRFDGNDVEVELPYTLAPGQKPNQVVIYYISDEGKLETVKNAKYNPATGKVEFKPKHFSKYAPAYVLVSFQDLSSAPWAIDAIAALTAREAIHGKSEGRFDPEGAVTRAEFVKMLVQLFDLEDSEARSSFTDAADPDTWYYASIASASKHGLVSGRDDGSFGVNEAINREDMAVILYRMWMNADIAKLQSHGMISFRDANQISDYAVEAVSAMKIANIMNGTSDSFEPKGQATRAMAATAIHRLYEQTRDSSSLSMERSPF
jgi:hypothetical protein